VIGPHQEAGQRADSVHHQLPPPPPNNSLNPFITPLSKKQLSLSDVSAYLLDGPFAWPGGSSAATAFTPGEQAAAAGDTLAGILQARARAGGATASPAAGGGGGVDTIATAAALASQASLALPAAVAATPPAAGGATAAQQPPASSLQEWLGRSARVVQLLDQFGIGMDLQTATSVHPRCAH